MAKTLQELKKYLKTTTLDNNLKFKEFKDGKLFSILDNGQKVYWLVNDDFTLKNNWYYPIE